jgi:uncharacterized membrane protein HdeD (DUF308 family)
MGSLSSPLGIIGVIILIIGIILFIIGIILVAINTSNPKPAYTWGLLVAGIIIAIIGAILMAVAGATGPTYAPGTTTTTTQIV